MTTFDQAFAIVVGEEGTYSSERTDPGNWTGNSVGSGTLVGTKYGIAAGSHPNVDIVALTLDAAKEIYRLEYWNKVSGDTLPPPLALVVFDAAVYNGVPRSSGWLQIAVGTTPDGVIGPATLSAVELKVEQSGGAALVAEVIAQRISFMGRLSTWSTYGLGWSRRFAMLPFHAMLMTK